MSKRTAADYEKMSPIDRMGRWLTWRRFILLMALSMFLMVIIFPCYWMISSSFKSEAEIGGREPVYIPAELRLDAYKELFDPDHASFWNFARSVVNSLIISIPTALIAVILSALGAYAIARLAFRGKNIMLNGILMIYLFPGVLIIIPLFAMVANLGRAFGFEVQDNLVVLLVLYLAQTLPVALYMLVNYFRTIPDEIEQAGLIDGCSRTGVIWRITLPLAVPALISVGIYAFMIAWNEFLYAFVFLNSREMFTMPIIINTIDGAPSPRPHVVMAASSIMTLPVIFLFLGMERYLTEGLASGGVKG